MIKNIFFKNGKQYLTVSKKNWNIYLDQISPFRNKKSSYCGLQDLKNSTFCYTCNKPLGKFSESCVNIITTKNLRNYSKILFNDFEKLENKNYYEIEIYNNDNISFP
jgi:hypothetical protein